MATTNDDGLAHGRRTDKRSGVPEIVGPDKARQTGFRISRAVLGFLTPTRNGRSHSKKEKKAGRRGVVRPRHPTIIG
jgi:hypothetical protein